MIEAGRKGAGILNAGGKCQGGNGTDAGDAHKPAANRAFRRAAFQQLI